VTILFHSSLVILASLFIIVILVGEVSDFVKVLFISSVAKVDLFVVNKGKILFGFHITQEDWIPTPDFEGFVHSIIFNEIFPCCSKFKEILIIYT
jgi:hypothetical protein